MSVESYDPNSLTLFETGAGGNFIAPMRRRGQTLTVNSPLNMFANKKYLFTLLAMVLLIVGGLNWGLYRFANIDLVEMIGAYTHEHVATVLYLLVALAAVWIFGVKFLRM
jgi:uncharacterized membrane protein YuzA (DUF378 family)